MPPRKPAVKRRMYRDPETAEKLAFMLAHQLHLQDVQQQRPFPETSLGRLPGEIRNNIYEHLLVAQPSQPTRYLRNPGAAVVDPKEIAAQRSLFAPAQNSKPGKSSYIAILSTCRQTYWEAYHVFYAKNSFQFTNAPDLIAFLRGIGPLRRAELTSLHIVGLVVDQALDKDVLHRYCLRFSISPAEEERVAAVRRPGLHPDICLYQTTKVLEGCKNLSKLVLEMRAEAGLYYLMFLTFYLGLRRPVTYLVDESHWVVVPCHDVELPASPPSAETVTKFQNYRDCFPVWARGSKVQVEVDIIREDSKQGLKKGFESWIAIG